MTIEFTPIIQKNIAPPNGSANSKYHLDQLEPGDSFAFPTSVCPSLSAAATAFKRKHKLKGVEWGYSIRRVGKDEYRIWRTK